MKTLIMNNAALIHAKSIKLLLLDVDGVLTPGYIYVLQDGGEVYRFNVYDGYGLELWKKLGFKTGFVTGRNSGAVFHRAQKLGIDFMEAGVSDKLEICEKIAEEESLSMDEIAFVGDDIQDIHLLRKVGFSATVANARDEVKEQVDYITHSRGGEGAVREVIEVILKAKGMWEDIISKHKINEKK